MTVYLKTHTIPRIQPLGGGVWTLNNMTELTILVGKNGSGKSVLLRSWRDQNQEGVHYVAPERTGEMDFQPQFIQQEMDVGNRRSGSTRNYVPDYRRRIIGRVQTYFMQRGNTRGQVIAPGNPDELESLLTSLTSDFSVTLKTGNPSYDLTRVRTDEKIGGVDQLSSGEAQLFTIGLDILTISAIWEIENRAQRILLIDEPDAHIHPDLQVRFAEFLLRVIDRFKLQVVVATHSMSLLAAAGQFGGDRTSVIFLQRTQHTFDAQKFDAARKEAATVLGGHVLMGPLFGAPLLLVEGDDDFRIWGQVPRHHVINLGVLPCNGDEIFKYQKSLERTLASISDAKAKPVGYALLDGDKALPTPNPQSPQVFIRFIQLFCHEAENLYVTNEVLAQWNLTWIEALERLKNAAAAKPKLEIFASPALDKRLVDLKGLMPYLVEVLDPKKVEWTLRVGAAIGNAKPSGELALFLGASVIDALWP